MAAQNVTFPSRYRWGSFFAASSATVDGIAPLEVFWDQFHITEEFGNWSQIASCGKAREILGEPALHISATPTGSVSLSMNTNAVETNVEETRQGALSQIVSGGTGALARPMSRAELIRGQCPQCC